jgi:antitoxin component of MazEF toxin-antitoxin module
MNQYTESEIRMMRVQALQGERSLTIVLPRNFASGLNIRKGDYLKVSLEGNKMILERAAL